MALDDLIAQSNQQEVTQLKNSLFRYLKKWPWVLLCVVFAVGIAYIRLKTVPKQYNVQSTIEVRKSQSIENPNDLLFGGRYARKLTAISDEAVIFKSIPLIRAAVSSLKFDVTYKIEEGFRSKELYREIPFVFEYDRASNPASVPFGISFEIRIKDQNTFTIKSEIPFKGKIVDTVGVFGEELRLKDFEFILQKTKMFEEFSSSNQPIFVSINTIENVAFAYRDRLKFEEGEMFSRILKMSLKTTNSQKSIDFMDKLIDEYVTQNLEDKNEAAKNTVEFIDQQLAIISDSLNRKEQNLETFKSAEKMSDLSVEGKLLIEKYNDIETERAKYQVMQQYYDYLKKNLNSGSDLNVLIAPSAFGIQDEIINELVRSLLELSITETKLIQEGNTKSPLLEQVQNRKKDLIGALNESIDNLSEANKIIMADLNQRAEDVGVSAQRLPVTERKLVSLSRLLKVNEKIYLFLMEKRSSAAISMSSNTPDCKVIEPAMLNPLKPVAPNKKMTYLIAVVLGIILPVLLIVLLDFLDDTITSKNEIESAINVPIMGLIPKEKSVDTKFVALERPNSVLAESFRIIRTNLSFFQKNKHPFVIMLTSTVAQEGKTFCAINLASILAASGKKTVLLGFDLRKPKIHNYLSIENNLGISNYLTERAELKDILTPTKQDGLFLINSGNIPPNPAELIIGKRTGDLINELKESFDYIILDTPPLGIVADALILKEHSDLNLYVVRQGYSKRDFLNRITELVEGGNMENLSILVNDADKATKYGSGYYELEKDRSFKKRFFGSRKA